MKYNAKDIENVIYEYLPEESGYPKKVIEAMNYAFRAGGKRLRPMMMKLCYDMYADPADVNDTSVVGPFMAAIEMIHTYSLIHDDLPALDNDELRRGLPTVHVKYGEDMAILAGDGLLNYAYETAAKAFSARPGDTNIEKAYTILACKPGINGMVGGQVLDVMLTGSPVDDNQLEYIYINKTAALIECSMMTGALLAGADDADTKCIEQAARAVGMAFQVQDDILDVTSSSEVLGKPVLSDEKNDKYTYVTIHGMDKSREYVNIMSERANQLIAGLNVINEDARIELMELIRMLIDREK